MSETLPPGTRLGPYEIDGLIGAGGMGRVYRARDPRLTRNVAIKTLSSAVAADPDGVRRFEAEARAAGALDHPNLLVVYDVGRENEVSYIVSELLDGETLRDRLRKGAIPERQVVDYAAQIARGLAAAHARGIVHRDLKPENVFLTRDRRAKILDFGIAKLVGPAEGKDATIVADSLTAFGTVVGTVGYMAPEQIRGEPIDHRADIFALGVVMHEMLSGLRPFERATRPETLSAILNDDCSDLPATVSPVLDRIVRRCLEKSREDRFHSAHDLGLALDFLATPATGTAPIVSRPGVIPRRKALLFGASSMALLGTGLAGGLLLDGQLQSSTPPAFRRLTFRRGLIRSARVAPDGETILYGALWEGAACRVHRARVNSPESAPLDLPDANVLAISRSGDLALALGAHPIGVITYGTLARVPMAGGAPREMVRDVKFADWSPDGADLAIVRLVDGRDRLEFPIGRTLVHQAANDGSGLGFARISPDGTHVAFVQYQAPDALTGRVCVVDQAGTITPLSDEYLNIHGLAWKGREILYTAADDRPLFRALCAVDRNGTPRTITRMPGNTTLWDVTQDGRLVLAHTDDRAVVIAQLPGDVGDRDLSWLDASSAADLSRDGRQLLFTEAGIGGGSEGAVYLRGTDGSAAVHLAAGRALALSPDTRWAACAAAGYPSPYLDLVPTGAGDVRRLPDHGLGYFAARWLPDGETLVVLAVEAGRAPRLYRLGLGQERPEPLTPEGVRFWAVSPDGSMIAALVSGEGTRLYAVDGGASRELPGVTAAEVPMGWIDDGVLVVRPIDEGSPLGEVYKVDVETGRSESWRNILPRDGAGIMALQSLSVTPDGRSRAYTWHRALSNLYIAEGLA